MVFAMSVMKIMMFFRNQKLGDVFLTNSAREDALNSQLERFITNGFWRSTPNRINVLLWAF